VIAVGTVLMLMVVATVGAVLVRVRHGGSLRVLGVHVILFAAAPAAAYRDAL
jgi:hypothetical protein